jgi:putative Mn2+ efflux pump MntP
MPASLDSVAAASGAAQATTAWQQLHISLVFLIFEGGMPLTGPGPGRALAHGIGRIAGAPAAAVIGIGAWMLLPGDQDEEDKADRIPPFAGLPSSASGSAST